MRKTPYKDLLPPLSTNEFESLKRDIELNGVRVPIMVDEAGNILDGHHRYSIDANAPAVVVEVPEDERAAFCIKQNMHRRNLSPEQRQEVAKKQREIAKTLNAAGKTQQQIADVLGVNQATIGRWLDTINMQTHNSSKHDARVKLSTTQKAAMVEEVQQGKPQAQVAADFGVSQQTVSNEKRKAEKHAEKVEVERQATEAAVEVIESTATGDENGIFHGDSFDLAQLLPDACCPLIFTDPPYDEESLPLYSDLAELADRILVDGGSLITYLGQYAMQDVINRLAGPLKFYWPLCCLHTGQTAQMKLRGLKVKWKPMLWFVKGTGRRDPHTWVEDLIESQQEKESHPWQQSVIEAAYYIERLSNEGDLIVDPFCGGGTTAVAANQSNRLWWTADIDAKHVKTARERINAIT